MAKCKSCGKHGLFLKLNSEGLCEDCEIIKEIKSKPSATSNDVNKLQSARARVYGTDLLEATCVGYHCGECAKYVNRVYSQSGKDSRFPKLPDYIKKHSDHCGIMLYPFVYGVNYMVDVYTGKTLTDKQVVEYSNRPYTDSRPPEWKAGYRRLEAKANNKRNCQDEYREICQKLPDIAPKSQAGYTRMKKAASANFQKISEAAREAGITIHDFENED